MRWLFFFWLSVQLCASATPEAATLESQTLVVCNDADPDSQALAVYYAERRAIPATQIISLPCPVQEEISREEYERLIAGPLRAKFAENEWWIFSSKSQQVSKNKIRFVALMRGMPLKIREEANYPGDVPGTTPPNNANGASLDSELAGLALPMKQISGPLKNPYFEEYGSFESTGIAQTMLVCRLDAPAVEDVRRMIDDSLAAEKSGLSGWAIFDARGIESVGYKLGDDWIHAAEAQVRGKGTPVLVDNIEQILPPGLPLPETAFYLGWYGGDFSGALKNPSFRFAPGAVACHIHSFSASTLRSPSVGWCGPLVANGAAAVLGNVYEPYLPLTAHLDIFTDRLLRGFTFAEAAWAALPAISWMSVNVGDPLYRPYGNTNHPPKEPLLSYQKSVRTELVDYSSGFFAEAWAQNKVSSGDNETAEVLFQAALREYNEPKALARVAWSYGQLLIAGKKKWQAIAVARKTQRRVTRDEAAASFLAAWLLELDPPPAPANTPVAKP